ncbi:uncharacterized protein LOC120846445 [Ixodes scapularis]|uniref:uncharacterized protein LOC120846445 n=1 Tax=Ixodes scapularis TaxID=6945 RepID=UPI001A9EBDDF|nr:uncharacterized protein LOC120846445 [Ixodes scapularis]
MGNAARLRFLLLQIFAAAWVVEEMPHPLTSNQRGFEEGSQFPSSPTTLADFLPGATFVWQRTGTLSCDISQQKEQPPTCWTGFGAGMGNGARLRFLLLQVSPVYLEVARHSSKRQPASFPSVLVNLCSWCRNFLSNPFATPVELTLILSGDVELNPGPLTDAQIHKLLKAVDLLPKLDKGQETLINDVAEINRNQVRLDKKFEALNMKFTAMEAEIAVLKSFKDYMQEIGALSTSLSAQVAPVSSRQDDTENRSRRNNLLFYGINDEPNETWSRSELKVIEFCQKNLEVTVAGDDIERAHGLGRSTSEKPRPFIVNFLSFKVKQHVLSQGFKLKNRGFSVDEDFSDKVRFERKQLLEHAKSQEMPYKLRFNKFSNEGVDYFYDSAEGRVKAKKILAATVSSSA